MYKLLIIRLYEDGEVVLTYSDNGSKKFLNKLYKKLEYETENKHFDRYEIYTNRENIGKEEDFINPYEE